MQDSLLQRTLLSVQILAGKKWQILADGIAGAAQTYSESTYYRGQLVQYGGDIFRHKLGITTNVAPLSAGNTQGVGIGNSVWDLWLKVSTLLVTSLQLMHTTLVMS